MCVVSPAVKGKEKGRSTKETNGHRIEYLRCRVVLKEQTIGAWNVKERKKKSTAKTRQTQKGSGGGIVRSWLDLENEKFLSLLALALSSSEKGAAALENNDQSQMERNAFHSPLPVGLQSGALAWQLLPEYQFLDAGRSFNKAAGATYSLQKDEGHDGGS